MMSPIGHSKFWALFVLSMALHATLFAIMSGQRQHAPVALPPILASIRLIAVSESGSVAAAAPAPAPATVPQKARQNPQRTEQRSAPRVTQTAGPANAPAQAASPQVVAAVESGGAVAVPPAAPVQATPAPAAPPQSELLDNYRQRLGQLFARHQEYPRIAALRGWEGEVRLRLKVARKGNLLGVQLDRSSGFEVLDQHALAMLEALASLPPLPDALESNEIQVVVPINYKLKKTT
ncbi:MAG: outer rane transport energization protein TonB [Proteobacteria bacterium]|nr:outer rane transport energization protein TonB [Pseudomonadota bacterium]